MSLVVSWGGWGGTKLTWNNHTWKNSFDVHLEELNVSTKIKKCSFYDHYNVYIQ